MTLTEPTLAPPLAPSTVDMAQIFAAHAERAARVADGGTSLHGTKGNNLRDFVFAVLVGHVLDHFISPIVSKIQINIRRRWPVWVEKPLKRDTMADRINIRNVRNIGN